MVTSHSYHVCHTVHGILLALNCYWLPVAACGNSIIGAHGQYFRHIIRENSISALQRNFVDMHQGDLFLPSLSVFRVYSN